MDESSQSYLTDLFKGGRDVVEEDDVIDVRGREFTEGIWTNDNDVRCAQLSLRTRAQQDSGWR